jgi:steroid Delta-isomerase
MPTHEEMVGAVERYVAAFDNSDPAAVRDLFAANATVEDPVGTPPHVGHEAIHAFYARSMKTGARLKLEGPVRTVGDTAAFPFSVHLTLANGPARIDVIDLFTFDDDGKITSMRAYFGPANFHQGAGTNA